MAETVPLFSVPVYVDEIEPLDIQTKNELKNLKFVPSYNGDNLSSTENKNILELPQFKELKNTIQKIVEKYARDELRIQEQTQFEIINSWVLKLEKGQNAQTHNHNNCIFSGCLYFDVGDDPANVVFVRPQHLEIFPGIDYRFDDYNIFNSHSWYFKPYDNMIILFPSHIPHHTEKNPNDYVRYSLAFDVWHRGTIDKHLYGKLKL